MADAMVTVTDGGKLEALLERLPIELRTKVLAKALKASGAPVVEMAKSLCPQSQMTGTRELWSKSLEAKRSGVKDLVETITSVVRDYGETQVLMVGPAYPAGALGHLVEFQRRKILWGRDSGATIEGKAFLRPAVDITKSDQRDAFYAVLQEATQ